MTDFSGVVPLPLVTRDRYSIEKEWLVSGLIGARETVCFVGPPGVGKSFFAVHVACQIARGQPIFGRSVTGGSVIYVAAERGEEILRRVEQHEALHGMRQFPLHILDGRFGVDLTKRDDWKKIAASVQGVGPISAIILDTKRKLIGDSDENSSRDLSRFFKSGDFLSREFDCSLIVLDHTPKSRSHESAGTNAFAGHVDLVMSLKSDKKIVRCRAVTAKSIETGEVGAFKIVNADVGVVEELSVPLTSGRPFAIRENDCRILETIKAHVVNGLVNRDDLRSACKRAGIYDGTDACRKSFQRSLENLVATNQITIDDNAITFIGCDV